MAKSADEARKAAMSKKPKIRVSQSTINDIKSLGMTKALALAGKNKNAEQAGLVAEFAEGVRRMYGDRRYQAATKPSPVMRKSGPPKSATTTRVGTAAKAATAKKPGTTDPFAKAVFGAGRTLKKALSANNGMTAAQVAAANKRRAAVVAAEKPKTAAQIAAEKKAAAARRAAAAAAVKKAGGRTA